jgi:predicted dehydrogenase
MLQILQSYKTGELRLADVPVPACKNNGIVVQTRASFVSAGTERMLVDFAKKNLLGKAMAMPDQAQKVLQKMKSEGIFATLEKVQAKLDQPIPLGYSCAGVIEEVGKNVQGLTRGDRIACGGALYANHAEYNFVPKNLVVTIPDSVSFEDASCATVGSIALQGIRQCDVRLGETVCVLGLGLLGMFAVQLLKAAGVRVVGFDPDKRRCALAIELGADSAVSDRVQAACEEISRGRGIDAVLITAATHSNEPVTLAGEICKMRGTVVATGKVGMNIPRETYYKKELSFKLSCSYGPGRYDPSYEEGGHDYPFGYVRWTEQRNIEAFIDCIAQGKVTPGKIITHRFTIDKALDAYDLMLGKLREPYLGIVLTYSEKEMGIVSDARTIQLKTSRRKSGEEVVAGFIGAGNFTKGVLFPNLKRVEGVRLKGLCTVSGMSSAETGKKEGFEFATTDQARILEDKDINAIFITTRHDTHSKLVVDALDAGKHVFVEKPLAMSAEELALIQAAVEKSPNVLMVGFNRRFSPHAGFIRNYFNGRTSPMAISYRVNAGSVQKGVWVQDQETGGGRIIGEVCHFIDFCSFIIGSSPGKIHAACIETNNAALVAEDSVTIAIKYPDGSVASIFYVALGSIDLPKERCEIFADGSVAVLENFEKTVCMGKRGKKALRGKQAKGFGEELSAFVKAVRVGEPSPIAFESLYQTSKATFAVVESIRNNSVQVRI